MAVHTWQSRQILPAEPAAVWAFFANPRNLARLTPPELGLEVLTPNLPERVTPGLLIAYRVRPLLGLPLTWLAEITHVDEGRRFIDQQRAGPYAFWQHEHIVQSAGDGRAEVVDHITYTLPFAPLGDLAQSWLVRPQLARLFAAREQALRQLFPG